MPTTILDVMLELTPADNIAEYCLEDTVNERAKGAQKKYPYHVDNRQDDAADSYGANLWPALEAYEPMHPMGSSITFTLWNNH